MNFPALLITDDPHELSLKIARALAEAQCYVSGMHWRLVMTTIEEPFQQWEFCHANASDSERDEKYEYFASVFRQDREKELERVLMTWGVRDQLSA